MVATGLKGVCFGYQHTAYFWYGDELVYSLCVEGGIYHTTRMTDQGEIARVIAAILERCLPLSLSYPKHTYSYPKSMFD